MKSNWKGAWGILLSVALLLGVPWLRVVHAQEVGGAQNGSAVFNTGVGTGPDSFVRGRVLVKFRGGVSDARARGLLEAYGAHTASRIPGIGVHVVELPPTAIEEHFVQTFGAHPDVEFAELDSIVQPQDITPNDPWYMNWQWSLKKISGPTAWSTTTGSGAVRIAVLDSGVDSTHEDLGGKLTPGWNTFSNSANTADVYGHGTLVAGTVAAAGNNGIGVASVAWGCPIMPIRVTDDAGNATNSAIASGLNWAADHGARVANVSFLLGNSSTINSAAKYFYDKGGLVTTSAGNYGTFDSSADNPYLISVGATDPNDALYSWSNTGNNVDLVAPGATRTTAVGNQYGSASGTSISAPAAAGVAALILSANPNLTPAQAEDILKKSADDLGSPGWDTSYGWGRINAARAVAMASGNTTPPDTTAPTVSLSSPTAGATVSGTVTVSVSASDNVGITSVGLSVDGVSLGSTTASPYIFSWDTSSAADGTHTLTATANDAAGNASGTSASVTVSNGPPPDTAAPTVSVGSPASGAAVSGTVTVQVSASDNVGVTAVSLSVDGVALGTAAAAPYIFSWDTSAAANGTHTLTATAKDSAGNTGTSAAVSVTVNNPPPPDATAPTVSISSPSNGAAVSGNVSVTVNAADNVGVVRVELYVDGALASTSTSSPFTTKWNTNRAAKGAHTLQCRAYDAAGNVGISPAVTVYK